MDLQDLLVRINDRLNKINTTLTEVKSDLKYHIKRTDMLEDEMKPVKKHILIVNTLCKLSLIILGAIGTIAGVIRVFL